MTSERPNRRVGSSKARKAPAARNLSESGRSTASIDIERSGGWMPPEELRDAALAALAANCDVALNLRGIDHLDASALQVLLALDAEQKRHLRNLQLTNTSPGLMRWFEFAGVVDLFFPDGAEKQ